MNKSQLIDKIAAGADISKAAAGRALDALIASVTESWDLRAPAPTPSHLRATVAIKGSFRGAEF